MPKQTSIYHKILTLITISAIITGFSFVNLQTVEATPQEDLAAIQRQLAEINAKKKSIENSIANEKNLQNQYLREINNIRNQIDLLNTQVQEKELTINELELQIQIMSEEMKTTELEISKAESEIGGLQDETDNRMVDIYITQKTSSNLNYMFSDGKKDLIKLSVYQKAVQSETNNLLYDLNIKKADLAEKETKLKNDKIIVEQDKASIEEQKLAIEKSKVDLDQQRAIYVRKQNESLANLGSAKNFLASVSFEQQKLLAQQQLKEQEIFNSVKSLPNGTYVVAGTIIGYQGCTGLCTGPHLHFGVKINGGMVNPCSQLTSGVLSGCGSGSGTLSWPMSGSFVLTSGYGPRWGTFHYGIDIANYNSSAAIKAAHNGWMFKGFDRCDSRNSLCKNGGANYVIICENKANCNQGRTTLYWHLR